MTIVASMLWRRLDSSGHDSCSLWRNEAGWRLEGAAVYQHEHGLARLAYDVQCDEHWRTDAGQVRGAVGTRVIDFAIARRGASWTLNDAPMPGLDHLVDLDLSFTPATNLQQLKRVAMALNQAVKVPVAWLNVDAGTLTELPQIYEPRSETTLWYEAPSVGYRGLLEVDPNGFIRRYPGLWEAEAS